MQWLGSPLFISHLVGLFGRGTTQPDPERGRKPTMDINHLLTGKIHVMFHPTKTLEITPVGYVGVIQSLDGLTVDLQGGIILQVPVINGL